jgi:hypothetical protein
MSVNPDFKDLFSIFNIESVEYLIVGAHAVIFYAEPRYTKDLDIWVNPTHENARRLWQALGSFGAPLDNLNIGDFTNEDLIYQIGVEPNRIDILMGVAGVEFDEAYRKAAQSTYGDVPIKILSKSDLIKSKKSVGRKQDLLDIERLEEEK